MKLILKHLLFCSFLSLAFISCKNDGEDPRVCWQVIDAAGNPLNEVCNKTAAQMEAAYGGPCTYYKTGPKFCWLVNGTDFIRDSPEDYIRLRQNCYFGGNTYTAVKVDCNYCGKWYHRLEKKYKPDNSITYSELKVQQFCGDTAATIYQGRRIVEKETADSLIVRQFSSNGTDW